jgi:hypothetical protein
MATLPISVGAAYCVGVDSPVEFLCGWFGTMFIGETAMAPLGGTNDDEGAGAFDVCADGSWCVDGVPPGSSFLLNRNLNFSPDFAPHFTCKAKGRSSPISATANQQSISLVLRNDESDSAHLYYPLVQTIRNVKTPLGQDPASSTP